MNFFTGLPNRRVSDNIDLIVNKQKKEQQKTRNRASSCPIVESNFRVGKRLSDRDTRFAEVLIDTCSIGRNNSDNSSKSFSSFERTTKEGTLKEISRSLYDCPLPPKKLLHEAIKQLKELRVQLIHKHNLDHPDEPYVYIERTNPQKHWSWPKTLIELNKFVDDLNDEELEETRKEIMNFFTGLPNRRVSDNIDLIVNKQKKEQQKTRIRASSCPIVESNFRVGKRHSDRDRFAEVLIDTCSTGQNNRSFSSFERTSKKETLKKISRSLYDYPLPPKKLLDEAIKQLKELRVQLIHKHNLDYPDDPYVYIEESKPQNYWSWPKTLIELNKFVDDLDDEELEETRKMMNVVAIEIH